MRAGTVQLWAENLGVRPEEVLSQVRCFLRLINAADEQVMRLRIMLHRSPDRRMDEALLQLERRVQAVHELLKDLQSDVLRDMS